MNHSISFKHFLLFMTLLFSQHAISSDQKTSKKFSILFIGDSLTEGYGIPKSSAYPSQVVLKLKQKGYKNVSYTNAGSSGATTAFGISAIPFQLKKLKPNLLVYALGSNDALRGLTPETTKKNIEQVIKIVKKENVSILLTGQKAPPNYGKTYSKKFDQIYTSLAKDYDVPLVPFLLEGVAGVEKYNISDKIHPNELGNQKIADTLLEPVIKIINQTQKGTLK